MSTTQKVKGEAFRIDDLLGKVRNRIYRVGVELEGGWRKLPSGVALVHDGSVSIPNTEPGPGGKPIPIHVGELPSTPMEVGKVAEFIEQFYPSHVNLSCGLHVHMSFKHALHYQKLMVPEYQTTMLTFLRKWAEKEGFSTSHYIWKRFSGKNDYCKDEFWADAQACSTNKGHSRNIPGSRYTAINFCHGLHGTMECRVLPMMDTWQQANRGVQTILDITNACLVIGAEREEKVKGEFIIDGGSDAARSDTRVVLPPPGVESEDESRY